MHELVKAIDEAFWKRLQIKTGWGRREVMEEYRKAVIEILATRSDPETKTK